MRKLFTSLSSFYLIAIFVVFSCKNEGEDYINKNLNAENVEFWLSDQSESKIFSKQTTGIDTGRVPEGTFENIVIDAEKYTVKVDNKPHNLPRKEFELLFLLASKPGKVFKRDKIMESVWGTDIIVGDRSIDVHIRKLREKFGSQHFKTIKGVGYKYVI